MANYTLPFATGLDSFVQNLQTALYNKLTPLWTLTTDTYNQFGRVYRNKTKDGYVPEFYNPTIPGYVAGTGTSSGGGMFFEDSLAVLSFFGLRDPDGNDKGTHTAKMDLYFFVNLSKITPAGIPLADQQGQRLDEICVNDVRNYLQSSGRNFTVHNTFKDIDKVLERYSGTFKRLTMDRDMHPNFCFRIELELRYNPLLNTYFKPS